MPGHHWHDRDRIGRIFDAAVHDLLERALIDSGVAPNEDVCIRHVASFITLRLSNTDAAVARAWSDALARAIRNASRTESADIVRYRSRAQALTDLTVRVARRDRSRAWAWRQLQLWRCEPHVGDTLAAQEVLRVLAENPALALPSLSAAGTDAIRMLVTSAPFDSWEALCDAVLHILSAPGWTAPPALLAGGDLVAGGESIRDLHVAAIADHILSRSVIARAVQGGTSIPTGVQALPTLATLALAEVEPTLFRDSRAPAIVSRLTRRFTEISDKDIARRDQASSATSNPAEPETPVARNLAEDRGDADVDHVGTDYGGLLYLINIVGTIELPGVSAEMDLLAARPPRWVFHQLAMVLSGCDARDPAALAFAGLAPDCESPSETQSPITEAEASAGDALAARVVDHLLLLFAHADHAPSAGDLVSWLCERPAQIVADPGWIEVRFPLDAVDTAIRRRGLDLNPDFVRWLGVVMRFAYV